MSIHLPSGYESGDAALVAVLQPMQVREAGSALQRADAEVFEKLIERAKAEGMITDLLGPPLEQLLRAHRKSLDQLAKEE
jgi:hypothetical protein